MVICAAWAPTRLGNRFADAASNRLHRPPRNLVHRNDLCQPKVGDRIHPCAQSCAISWHLACWRSYTTRSHMLLACRHLPALRNTLRMSRHKNENRFLSRRSLLKTMGLAPLLLRPAPFHGSSFLFGSPMAFPASRIRFSFLRCSSDALTIRRKSPLEDVLRLVAPGSDEYVTEKYAFEIESLLQTMERGPSRRRLAIFQPWQSRWTLRSKPPRWFPKRKSRCVPETGSIA